MTEPTLISRQRTILHDLYRVIAERAETEPRIEQEFKARTEAGEKWFQESCQQVITRFETDKQASQQEFEETEARVTLIDGLLAVAVLAGLVLNAAFDWWWADPLAAFVIVYYGLREGRAALPGSSI